MITISRSVPCDSCGNSAEGRDGKFGAFLAPDCHDPQCSRVAEIGHFHVTQATILCQRCAEKRGVARKREN